MKDVAIISSGLVSLIFLIALIGYSLKVFLKFKKANRKDRDLKKLVKIQERIKNHERI